MPQTKRSCKAAETPRKNPAPDNDVVVKSTEYVTESDIEGESPPASPKMKAETTKKPVELQNARFVWKYKQIDSTPSTHASMIGGSFVVPLEKRNQFYVKYYNEFAKWLNDTTIPPN